MQKLMVFYDETCGMCKIVMSVLSKLGSGQRVMYLEAQTMDEFVSDRQALENRYYDLHSFAGDRVFKGYDAYINIAKRTLLLLPLYPIMLLPFVRWIGEKIYRNIADARTCALNQGKS